MKKLCFLLLVSCFSTGCNPSFRLYVKNSTDRNIDLDLILFEVLDGMFYETTDTLYAYFEQDLIDNIKWSTAKRLTQKDNIKSLNDNFLHINICNHSTYLIISGRFIPFEKIIVNQEHRIDTLSMYGKNRNVRRNMEQIKVRNKGFWYITKIIELF